MTMMTEQLCMIVQQIEELPADEQNLLAEQITDLLLPQDERETYIGSIPDLPDDAEDIYCNGVERFLQRRQ